MTKFVKKPVVIEAVQYTGKNQEEIEDFCGEAICGPLVYERPFRVGTLEGEHVASIGDWIIKGVAGEFYPCKPEIFDATYAEVEDD